MYIYIYILLTRLFLSFINIYTHMHTCISIYVHTLNHNTGQYIFPLHTRFHNGCTMIPGPGDTLMIPGPGDMLMIPGPSDVLMIPGPGDTLIIPGPGDVLMIPGPGDVLMIPGPGDVLMIPGPGDAFDCSGSP
jgi:hypothetical protein